jgi:uncharacterized protein (TIGR03086 family)
MSAPAAFGLLERSIGYALGTVRVASADSLQVPTPCAGWDLGTLLGHVNETLDLLRTCIETEPAGASPPADPLDGFRTRATRLLGALSNRCPTQRSVLAGGYRLAVGLVAGTGAVEIAVHGWDISRTTHEPRPIPSGLADDLLGVARVLARDAGHHRLFASPVAVPPGAGPGDRLVAVLGRYPAARTTRV